MNRGMWMAMTALAAGVAAAAPTVSDVTVSQDAETRLITVGYDLSEAAIVTFEAYTNGVSIGGAPLRTAFGDVWGKVKAGEAKQIRWQPRTTFPQDVVDDGSFTVKVRAWALDNPPDYMVVDMMMPSNICWYASADQLPYGVGHTLYKTASLVMRRIRATGVQWQMGVADGEKADLAAIEVSHPVMLTNDYYMAIYKMTEGQHVRASGSPSTACKPMINVSYATIRGAEPTYDWPTTGHAVDPNSICGKLRAFTGIGSFDLPTEAQWEFAVRAGTTDTCVGFATIGEVAWCDDGSVDWKAHGASGLKARQVVGLLQPNNFGIYDPIGNGFELCRDYYAAGDAYARKGVLQVEPTGPTSVEGGCRVLRSGSWAHLSAYSRPAHRYEGGVTSSYAGGYVTYRLVCGCDFRQGGVK